MVSSFSASETSIGTRSRDFGLGLEPILLVLAVNAARGHKQFIGALGDQIADFLRQLEEGIAFDDFDALRQAHSRLSIGLVTLSSPREDINFGFDSGT